MIPKEHREPEWTGLSDWERFAQTGKVCDYLRYAAQQNREGTKNYAGDSQRTGDPGKNTQQ